MKFLADLTTEQKVALAAIGVAGAAGLYFLLRPKEAEASVQIPEQSPFPQLVPLQEEENSALTMGGGGSKKSTALKTGDIMLAGRPSYVLVPGGVQSDTPIFVILHGGFGSASKPKQLGEAATSGKIGFDLLSFEGATDQALALMGRKAQADGFLVVYLGAGNKKQWSPEDIGYVRSAIDELRTRSGADGSVKVSGAAAGLLIAGTLTDLFKNERAA